MDSGPPISPYPGGGRSGTTKDRRRFLRDAALAVSATTSAALLGSLSGCSEPRPSSATTSRPSPPSAPASSTTVALSPAAWSALAGSLQGTLVLPTSAAYPSAKLVYDQRFDGIDPAAVAYCTTAADVQTCVAFVRHHGVSATPRAGGHSYGGYSTGTGLIIDVSRMNQVTSDPKAMTAVIGAGTQLVDVYNQLSSDGMLLPAGSCPTVGIAGLTLGGGIGVVGRKYGLTCDNLSALQIVTSDGRILVCSESENADLYWASRGGGGGNFGIVTSFTFGVHPIPALALFTVNWPWAAAGGVLGAWQEWMATAPDELWSNCELQSGGASGLNVRSNGVFVGTSSGLTDLLRPFLARAGSPSGQFVGADPYLHTMLVEAGCEDISVAQCHLSGAGTAGTLARSSFAATSSYLTSALTGAGLSAATGAVEHLHETVPTLGGGMVFDAYGGAINAVDPAATAFVHRQALCGIQTSASWGPGTDPATVGAAQGWLQQTASAMAPFGNGAAYQNYIDPTLADWAQAYYGSNLPRLVAVKHRYDPDDFFHFAQSIPTTLRT